ncbi:MAG: hypothetical protein V3T70_03635 [Phycisphaerae bacterium]
MLVSLVLTGWVAARLLAPLGFVQSQLARLKFWQTPGMADAYQRVLNNQPWINANSAAVVANRRLLFLVRDVQRGRIPAARASADAMQRIDADASNGLSRLCAAWLAAEQRRDAGEGMGAVSAEFLATWRSGPAPSRVSNYRAQELARQRAALTRYVRRRELPLLLTDRGPPRPLVEILPPLIDAVNRFADGLDAAGRSTDAETCRSIALSMPVGLLRDEPTPASALLCAALVARTAQRHVDEPQNAGGADWWNIADEAKRFRSDLSAALVQADHDLFDRRPIPGGGGYNAAWTAFLAAALLCAGGLLACGDRLLRAVVAIVRHKEPNAAARRPPRRTTIFAAIAATIPAWLATLALWRQLRHGIDYSLWYVPLCAAALIASVAIVRVTAGGFRHGLRTHSAAALIALLLSGYLLAPPIWSSRLDYWAGRHPIGFAAAVLIGIAVLIAVALWRMRRNRGIPQAARTAPRAHVWSGVAAWTLASVMAFAACVAYVMADRAYAEAVMRDPARVDTWLNQNWREDYFAAAFKVSGRNAAR